MTKGKKASQRKGLSKTIRFEVFKRDNFTCQYCGKAAPDVILECDHISPVAGGGGNEIVNLVTSCKDCNAGKGARPLDDDSVLAKQRAQLAELNERREQLEMMMSWREGLKSIDEDYVDALEGAIHDATGFTLSDVGRNNMRANLKRFPMGELLDALDASVATYWKHDDTDEGKTAAAEKVISSIPKICAAKKRYADRPYMKDLFYIRAIIRNRMYCNERVAIDLLEQAYNLGAQTIDLQDWAKRARNWTNWRNEMETWIAELESAK